MTDGEERKNRGRPESAELHMMLAETPDVMERAKKLAEEMDLIFITDEGQTADEKVWLTLNHDGLAMTDGVMRVSADFTAFLPRLRPDRIGTELLVKAAGRKKGTEKPLAVDAAAGFGQDALLLAAAGWRVLMFERDPVVAALLRDALDRAAVVPALADPVSRMCLRSEDSILALGRLEETPAVIYLDPMFPEKKKSSLTGKKFQLLHLLERPCDEENEILRAAWNAGPGRIVIKRPLKGPYLAGIHPAWSLKGKAVRYDCLMPSGRIGVEAGREEPACTSCKNDREKS